MVCEAALIFVVTIAAVTDVLKGKIPNWLTYPASVFGISLALALNGWIGASNRLGAFVVGFLPFFLLYLIGSMGGGDVKLMAAVGALMGWPFILNAIVTSILVGGCIALLIVIWEGKLLDAIRYVACTIRHIFYSAARSPAIETRQQVPFGVAICLGSFLTLVSLRQGYASPAEFLATFLTEALEL